MFAQSEFADFDDFQKMAGDWDLDFRQLDRGAAAVSAARVKSRHASILRIQFGRRYEQIGCPPPDTLSVGVPDRIIDNLRWRSALVPPASLICFAPDKEFMGVSQPGFVGSTLSFDAAHLARISDDVGESKTTDMMALPLVISGADITAVSGLQRSISSLFGLAATGTDMPPSWVSKLLHEDIPMGLIEILSSSEHDTPAGRPPLRERDRARKRAMVYINEHAHEAPTVAAICRAAGVSWRTLDYAFREQFGLTPKAYLQATRLQAVRNSLKKSDRQALIADIAGNWGFWHMGQFAADYRRMFGELPSETLAG